MRLFDKYLRLFCFLLFKAFCLCECLKNDLPVKVKSEVKSQSLGQQWSEIGEFFETVIWPHKSGASDIMLQALNDKELHFTANCRKSLQMFAKGLKRRDLWAFEMLDASAKGDSGYLTRLLVDFGAYDQCLDVKVNEGGLAFGGKYCLYRMTFPIPTRDQNMDKVDLKGSLMEGTWVEKTTEFYKFFYYEKISAGICFPSTCEYPEIEAAVHKFVAKRAPINITFWPTCDTEDIYQQTYFDFPLYKRLAISVVQSLACLVVASTLVLAWCPRFAPNFLKHFSISENSSKLFQVATDEASKKLAFVHGVRVGYLFLVVGFHVGIVSAIWTPITHSKYPFYKSPNIPLLDEFTSNIGVGIGVNFVIGGLLAFYSWYPELVKTNGNLSFFKFVVGRWFRTFPLVLGTITFIFAMPVTWGSGPVWRYALNKITDNCFKNGWMEFLFISNHIDPRDSCLVHAWYLAADFQLYLTSFFVIILLYKRPKLGVILTLSIIFLGIVIQGVMIYLMDAPPFLNTTTVDYDKLLTEDASLHFLAYNYISPYYMGILIAYLIINDYKVEDKRLQALGWLVFSAASLSVYEIPNLMKPEGFTRTQEIIFGSLQRALFASGWTWGFYCGAVGKAGFINSMLTCRIFVPLGRCSFSIFICHFLVIWYDVFTSRGVIEFRTFSLLARMFYTLFMSTILGYIMYLLFEAPFINVAKAFFVKKTQPTEINNNLGDINNNIVQNNFGKCNGNSSQKLKQR